MFYLILFTVLLWINPSGKLLEYWGWNHHVTKTEWVQSKTENSKTFQLTTRNIVNLLTPKIIYFFDFHLIVLYEKITTQEINSLLISQKKIYTDTQIQRLAYCTFNIQYPYEDYKIRTTSRSTIL